MFYILRAYASTEQYQDDSMRLQTDGQDILAFHTFEEARHHCDTVLFNNGLVYREHGEQEVYNIYVVDADDKDGPRYDAVHRLLHNDNDPIPAPWMTA